VTEIVNIVLQSIDPKARAVFKLAADIHDEGQGGQNDFFNWAFLNIDDFVDFLRVNSKILKDRAKCD
jgi:hypothetical protein